MAKMLLAERKKPNNWQPFYCIFKKLAFDSVNPTGNSLVDTCLSLACGSGESFNCRE